MGIRGLRTQAGRSEDLDSKIMLLAAEKGYEGVVPEQPDGLTAGPLDCFGESGTSLCENHWDRHVSASRRLSQSRVFALPHHRKTIRNLTVALSASLIREEHGRRPWMNRNQGCPKPLALCGFEMSAWDVAPAPSPACGAQQKVSSRLHRHMGP